MTLTSVPVGFSDIAHRVRELVCTYRPASARPGEMDGRRLCVVRVLNQLLRDGRGWVLIP
jgi:hypothetical protein